MKKLSVIMLPLLILALLFTVSACGDDDEEATPTPSKTAMGTATPQPTATEAGYTGESKTFKLAHASTATGLTGQAAEMIDEKLREYTDGKVKLEIFPMGSLYSSNEMFDAVATGGIDMVLFGDANCMPKGILDFMATYLPFFVGNTQMSSTTDVGDVFEHGRRFIEHPDGGPKLLAQLEPKGIKGFCIVPATYNQILVTNKFELTSRYQCKGMLMRDAGGVSSLAVQHVGAKGIVLDTGEENIAFEQGLIEVLSLSIDQAYLQGWGEAAKYGLITATVSSHTIPAMNLSLWNKLSPELQEVILQIMDEVYEWGWEAAPEYELYYAQKLIDDGMIVHYLTPEERSESREAIFAMAQSSGILNYIKPEVITLLDSLR